ncbi:MAG: hypothetical protein RIS36_631 [Pseudomonadota bacterium]|jgi:hypothetical protein
MWITARLIIATVACLYRLLFRHVPKSFPLTHNGVAYSVSSPPVHKSKLPAQLETPVDSRFICALSRETSFDRWATRLGFGDELQVRDTNFDDAVFILGDHPLTVEYLSSSTDLRNRIRALIPQSVSSIAITGKTLRFVVQPGVDPNGLLDDLVMMRTALEQIQHTAKSRFTDPHYTKALILQAFIMGVAAYGLMGFAEVTLKNEAHHLNDPSIAMAGIWVSIGIATALVTLTWILLRHSSRAPRLMVENGAILLLSLPVLGHVVISDINRGMDRSLPAVVTSRLVSKHTEVHRGRRSSHTLYYFEVKHDVVTSPFQFEVPRLISVSQDVYQQLEQGDAIQLTIAQGFLGYPWYVSIGRPPPP